MFSTAADLNIIINIVGPSSALRPQSHDMSFIEYHNLDIIFVAFIVGLTGIYLFMKLTCILLKRFGLRKVKNE